MEKNIILVGLGPHARRIYYPLLEKYAVKLALVVDLADQEDVIRHYLSGRALQPECLFFAQTKNRNGGALDESLLPVLDGIAAKERIDGIIISTEPKAHKPYVLWALDRDVDVLMDKPVTAPVDAGNSLASARQIFEDYQAIGQRLARSKANMIVQCQRRSHEGYRFVKTYLEDFVREYRIPVSYIDIYHGDGMWCMPAELFNRENHPYKYGYGKLMHSGYHFVDLFAWLAEVNNLVERKKPNVADLVVKRFGAYDFLHQVDEADYERLFETDRFSSFFEPARLQEARRFGEIDVFALCQLKRGDAVVTTASINLQQNSFSRRAWADPPEDGYKGNGRVRHERVVIQVANLLAIQVHSYQAYEVSKKDVETEGPGHGDHFDIYIFRNSGLVGGKPLEKFRIGEDARQRSQGDTSYLGHNEKAREANFLDFLEGRPGPSHFATHAMTNRLLSKIYECIARENNGSPSQLSFDL